MANRRAPFIVVEGLDRSGKTTQTSRLNSRLEVLGFKTKLLKFPGLLKLEHLFISSDRTTAIGQMIDSYLCSTSELDDRAIHLLFSANRWELAKTIEKLVNEGTTVICDRYAFSGIAFSAAKVDAQKEPLLSFEWCKNPDVGLPAPDLVLFFDVPPDKAKERGGYGDERYEKEEMQLRVREFFHRIGRAMIEDELKEGEGAIVKRWKFIDAGKDIEAVAGDVWSLVEPLASRGVGDPLRKLWVDV